MAYGNCWALSASCYFSVNFNVNKLGNIGVGLGFVAFSHVCDVVLLRSTSRDDSVWMDLEDAPAFCFNVENALALAYKRFVVEGDSIFVISNINSEMIRNEPTWT